MDNSRRFSRTDASRRFGLRRSSTLSYRAERCRRRLPASRESREDRRSPKRGHVPSLSSKSSQTNSLAAVEIDCRAGEEWGAALEQSRDQPPYILRLANLASRNSPNHCVMVFGVAEPFAVELGQDITRCNIDNLDLVARPF